MVGFHGNCQWEDHGLWMCPSHVVDELVNRLANSGIGLVDASEQLWYNFKPCVHADSANALCDRRIDFYVVAVGEPER